MTRKPETIWMKGFYWWMLGLMVGGILLAELTYYHWFDWEGMLVTIFSTEEKVAEQGWWNDERKGIWMFGAIGSMAFLSIIVEPFRYR